MSKDKTEARQLVTVMIETTLTPELVAEGLAREFVSKVQNLRKEADFEVTQRIRLVVTGDAEACAAVAAFREHVMAETLCTALDFVDVADGTDADLNGHACRIRLEKAG